METRNYAVVQVEQRTDEFLKVSQSVAVLPEILINLKVSSFEDCCNVPKRMSEFFIQEP